MTYISRSLEPVLERAAREFPAVVLTGPRQSGKTTLLRHLFPEVRYVSLEPPDIRGAAAGDPRGFLALNPPPVLFDEVQYAPDLLIYIKEWVDAHRELTGRFLLTGSQNLMLASQVSESLAGRAALLRLLPLSLREVQGAPEAPLCWEAAGPPRPTIPTGELWRDFLRGFYPELVANPGRDFVLWQASYLQTYLERDVRMLRQVGDLVSFQSFLRALAARCGQLLNLSELARDIGVTVNTAKSWLSVLEATSQIVVLRPYFANLGKRLTKSPKVYFTDVGLLCYLVGLREPAHAAGGPLAGAIFEAAVLAELLKTFWHRGQEPQLYFWRTASGVEVDFVVEQAGRLIPIEVKLSATPHPRMAAGIRSFQKDFPTQATGGYVVHPGEITLPLAPEVIAVPFSRL